MKIAALDLGSNTFLCLIAEGNKTQGITHVYEDLTEVVRLGQGLSQSAHFHPEALARAKQCLMRFRQKMDEHNVQHVLAMATSAARDAQNKEELLKIARDLNIPLEIIAGANEAQITYQGATSGDQQSQQKKLIIDIGGGSTELILGQEKQILFAKSLDIGGVRLTEKLISQQPISTSEQKAAEEFIAQAVAESLATIKTTGVDQILAVAGTPTALAAIDFGGFDAKKIEGYFIGLQKLQEWQKVFAATSVEEKKQKYNLGGRADIIYIGVTILKQIVEKLKLDGFYVSTKGVRYGVALELLRRLDF